MKNSYNCKKCSELFVIEPEDFAFYERIGVPSPTLCPQCRMIRRLIWLDERALYHDRCDRCKKEIFSLYAPESPFTVYCQPCWFSDQWDPLDYGREYDFERPFFQQFEELLKKVPRPATVNTNSVNCRYCNDTINSKNCYYSFVTYESEDCLHTTAPLMTKWGVDSLTTMNADHVYECILVTHAYNLKFSQNSEDCIDSSFLVDCKGCTNCFGGVNLRNSKYALFNQQLSKEEYFKQMEYWDMGSYARLREAKEKFDELLLRTPRRHAFITNSVEVKGDNIFNCKSCTYCFNALNGVEDCKYVYYSGLQLKDSYDVNLGGDLCELLYETSDAIRAQNVVCSIRARYSKNIQYSERLTDCADCFGCIGLRSKKFCVLNHQYSKENYEMLVKKIKKHMGADYGEFFPAEMSPFAFNQSQAWQWFFYTKEETLKRGYRWYDEAPREHTITMEPAKLPDHIRDASDSLVSETIGCEHNGNCNDQCTKAFRVTSDELGFYRQMNIALPRLCPNCRHHQRTRRRNPMKLWHRTCMRDGCKNDFDTSYSPERPEIIYCQECYKHEFL